MAGPVSSTLNAVARFENTTGKAVKSSAVTVSDSADLAGVTSLSMAASSSGVLTVIPTAVTTPHTLVLPGAPGAAGTVLKAHDSSGALEWGAVGDMYGPPSAAGNAVVRFDSSTGKLVKSSDIFISDVAGLSGVKQLSMTGSAFGTLTLRPADATTFHTLTMPGTVGAQGTYLKASDGAGVLEWGAAGDVLGPSSSSNNQLARFNGTTGKLVKACPLVVSDTADVSMVKTLAMHGSSSGASTLRAAAVTADHTLTLPADKGAQGTVLTAADNSGTLAWAVAGNVVGPADSSNLAVAVFDGTTGKAIRNSAVTVTANADVEGVKTLALAGSSSGAVTLRPAAVTTPHSLTLPASKGATGTVLQISDSTAGTLAWTPFPAATGDVIGPASVAANTVALYNGATGKLIKDSVVAINSAGDVTGVATLTVTSKVTGLASPTDSSDATNKSYVDSAIAGLKWKAPVRVAVTSNVGSISGLQTIDGVALLAGDRVLLLAQTTGAQNGIYLAAAGSWSRSADMSAGSSAAGSAIFVTAGVAGTGNAYSCTSAAGSDVVGTDALVFVIFAYNPSGGNVIGPATASNDAIARFDSTTGKLVKNSTVTVSDAAAVAGVKSLALSGASSGAVTLLPAAATSTHSLTLPADRGATGTFLRVADNPTGELAWASAVTSAGASTDNAVARFDSTTGIVVQNSGVLISDTNSMSGLASISLSGSTSGAVALVPAASTTSHILTLPATKGPTGTFLQLSDATTGELGWTMPSGSGDVTGPASSTDNAVARFDALTGKMLQNSAITISDTADLAGAKTLTLNGSASGTLTLQPAATTDSYSVTLPSVQGGAGTFLRNDGTGALAWVSAGGGTGAGNLLNMQVFNSAAGNFVYNPSPGCTRALVYVVGGGGAGGGCAGGGTKSTGAGGAGGGCRVGLFAVANGASGSVVVGGGGAGVSGAAGNSGASSTFTYGTGTITGAGGAGGTTTTNANLAFGNAAALALGTATANDAALLNSYQMMGSQGFRAETYAATACVFPGGGGNSALGGGALPPGGAAGGSIGAAGVAGVNGVGGGGSGAFQTDNTARAGGTGGFGGVYVLEYANSNGIGDLIGPSGATDNAIARYDTITGKQLQNSGVTISDTADVAGAKTLAMSGATSGTLTLQPAATTTSYTLTLPSAQGILGAVLFNDGAGGLSWVAPAQPGLFWSAQANGDPRTGQPINATFNGNTSWRDNFDGITLASNNNNQTGCANWNVAGFDFNRDWQITCGLWQQSADGVFIGWGGNAAFTSQTSNVNGLMFQFNTYTNTTSWYRNNTALGLAGYRAGVNYEDSWMSITLEQRRVGGKRYITAFHGDRRTVQSVLESTSYTYGGNFMGVGARTGLANGNHFCNFFTCNYI
jgi:hypothetical protein